LQTLTSVARVIRICSLVALATLAQGTALYAQNWAGFRGDGEGVSDLKGLPTTWSEGDYAWRIELPGEGHAAPCVWGH
jgi:hypothetical protein